MNTQLLQIADLNYQLSSELKLTSNYDPFVRSYDDSLKIATVISVGEISVHEKELCHQGLLIDDEKEFCVYKINENDGGYYATVKSKRADDVFELLASPSWDEVCLSSNCATSKCPESILDIMLMLVFIYSSAAYKTILLHASCIKLGNNGLAFIGHSGAGKSTHSRLWLTHVPGTTLLNDDQPAVRVFDDGRVLIYGTPWSGKTACYKSDFASLKGIVRMKQAPYNKITALSPVFLFQELLSSCSMLKSDLASFKLITSALAEVASHVHGFVLENKPEKEAVTLVFAQTLQNE